MEGEGADTTFWQKFSFNALLLKWSQRVTRRSKVRLCRAAVRFSSRCEMVKVFQESAEQLVLILRARVRVRLECHIHDFAIWKEAAVVLFCVRGGVRPRCSSLFIFMLLSFSSAGKQAAKLEESGGACEGILKNVGNRTPAAPFYFWSMDTKSVLVCGYSRSSVSDIFQNIWFAEVIQVSKNKNFKYSLFKWPTLPEKNEFLLQNTKLYIFWKSSPVLTSKNSKDTK